MQIPKQIAEFADQVRTKTAELSDLVAQYNDLSERRQKISEIPQEYLKVQPFSPEDVRRLLLQGMDVELERINADADELRGNIYRISCDYPDFLNNQNQQ